MRIRIWDSEIFFDPGDPGSGIEEFGSWIPDKHPGSATLTTFLFEQVVESFDVHIPGEGVWTGPGMEKFVSGLPDKHPLDPQH
jgi:hypothetical protein